jgi:hypothetical protein
VAKLKGVIPHVVEEGLSILRFADDMTIFMEYDIEQAKKYEVNI